MISLTISSSVNIKDQGADTDKNQSRTFAYYAWSEKHVREYMENGGHFYAKLLGFRKDRQDLLSIIAKKSALPLLTRLSDTDSISEIGQKMLRHDILASNLYQSVITDKYKTAFRNEYKQPMLKI